MGHVVHILTALICSFSLAGCTPAAHEETPALSSSGSSSASTTASDVDQLTVEVVNTHPFDPETFTQGLEVDEDGSLLVSHGTYGHSGLYRRTVDGAVTQSTALGDEYFGEGLTRTGDAIWMLTWEEHTAFRIDPETLEPQETVGYAGEGWGLCSTDSAVYMTDGTAALIERDPQTFAERGRVTVTRDGAPVQKLNELSCAPDDTIYANVFLTDEIVRIDPATGTVTGLIDASGLRPADATDPNAVLNGIAHIPSTDRFYLTGKMWPVMYEVRFVPS